VEILYQPAKYILRYYWRRTGTRKPVFITPTELRFSLERLGATFVKFGQLLSMRSDYIHCAELQKLLDRKDGTIAYVDFGIVGTLDENARAVLWEYMCSNQRRGGSE
jgi:predicted unusual protein kinase regulating ubiquinone biosynthesis (AarF/ABC1/UbiB family)